MKSINTSIASFKNIRDGGYLYVDKTKYIYDMVKEPFGQFFFSRPRRFGKSLTVSTLEAIFDGEKELFNGCYIYDTDYNWEAYPVIHIDFGRSDSTTKANLEAWLTSEVKSIADSYGVDIKGRTPAILFGELIKALNYKLGKKVVILIDEYDRPITNNVEDSKRVTEIRIMMEAFYQMIKGYEELERFVFLTGITRLSQLSIFSKLNNLNDISRNVKFAALAGYTQEELLQYFADYISDGAQKRGIKEEKLISELARWYDGFRFTSSSVKMYNPVSIGQFFYNNCEFRNYWYATATPVMLINQAKKQKLSVEAIAGAAFSEISYNSFDITALSGDDINTQMLIQLLFQTGYLTIGELIEGPLLPTYRLVYPNLEVRSSFEMELASIYSGQGVQEVNSYVIGIQQASISGNVAEMMNILKNLIAGIPYDIQLKYEKYYQSLMFLIFRICGMDVEAEKSTNIGRIDAVMRSGDYIYIIECKINKDAANAVNQIDVNKYSEPYKESLKEGKKLIGVGINFSYDDNVRNISDYKVTYL